MSIARRTGTATLLVPAVLAFIIFSNKAVFLLFTLFLGFAFAFEFFWNIVDCGALEKIFGVLFTSVGLIGFCHFGISALFFAVLTCIFLVYLGIATFLSNDRWTRGGSIAIFFFYILAPLSIMFRTWEMFGKMALVFLLVSVWVGDVFAYLVGTKWGKRPLFPRVSPKKTVEGLLGNIFGVFLASFILYPILIRQGFSFYLPVFLSISFPCVFGDLVESSMKRMAGIKDSSSLLPGHGGFLDRFDSFVFSVPFFYLVLRLIHR